MSTKEYRLTTQFQGELNLNVNGTPVNIKFTNGQFTGGLRKNGYCTIKDPDIQEALESHPLFTTMYVITRITEEREVKKTVTEKVIVDVVKEEASAGVYSGITNIQKAKLKLIELFPGTTHAKLPNKEAVLDFAKEHNISFPDWEL